MLLLSIRFNCMDFCITYLSPEIKKLTVPLQLDKVQTNMVVRIVTSDPAGSTLLKEATTTVAQGKALGVMVFTVH